MVIPSHMSHLNPGLTTTHLGCQTLSERSSFAGGASRGHGFEHLPLSMLLLLCNLGNGASVRPIEPDACPVLGNACKLQQGCSCHTCSMPKGGSREFHMVVQVPVLHGAKMSIQWEEATVHQCPLCVQAASGSCSCICLPLSQNPSKFDIPALWKTGLFSPIWSPGLLSMSTLDSLGTWELAGN